MNFQDAVRNVLSNYATFSGRAPRSEFWWWVLAVLIAVLVAGLLDSLLFGGSDGGFQPLSTVLGLGVILPNLAVAVRRLHDTHRTGWWFMIGLVPVIGLRGLLWLDVP
jgi:uncharacterized membrane protein YhaH (DUF805 family)